jgi:hypothetical protein
VIEQPVEHRCSRHRVAGKGLIPRPDGRTVIRAVAGFGEPIELSGWVRSAVTHRPDQAASHQGRAVGAASAWRNRRFESVPSSGESPRLTQTRPLQVENRGFRAAVRARLAALSAEERLALVQPGIVVLGQVRVCDSQWARMLILCARAKSTGSAKQAADAGPFTWAGRSRSASKTSR